MFFIIKYAFVYSINIVNYNSKYYGPIFNKKKRGKRQ